MKTDCKSDDPMDEVYAVRREISERYGHDIDRYFEAMLERHRDDEATGRRKYLRPPARRKS